MKPNDASRSTPKPRPTLLVAVLCFLLGAALTGFWLHRPATKSSSTELAAATKTSLSQLPAPVTIRYYSLLPAGSADATLQAFAGRVATLLENMQAASGGKVQLTSFEKPGDTNTAAAGDDGVTAFNLDKGDACFLGLAIASGKNKESFARLQPEWEPALEYDLVRAILRVATPAAAAKLAPEIAKPSAELVASINTLIPDVANTSVETANQLFHDDFMKQCSEAGAEMEKKLAAAEQQVVQAQDNGTAAELEAAQKNLAQLRASQADNIKQIAARLQQQMAVFQQLKNRAANNGK